MNKTIINVPEGITKLSQWTDFGNYLPSGRFILNKKITGCGATTYFLECSVPVILCSHRTELLECKAKSNRHLGKVHLFKLKSDNSKDSLCENMKSLREYIQACKGLTDPFGTVIHETAVPKILVTTDSLHHVLNILSDIGILSEFSVVSDEMQCIFTDAAFKGDSVLNYLSSLNYMQNVIFLSATPYLENYLDKLPEFRDLPYIELNWPPSTVDDVKVSPYYVKSLYTAAKSRIEFFKEHGYFEENGYHKATRAVFFINSISDIIKLIKGCNLDQSEVNIICSTTNEKTLLKLKKAGLSPGHVQLETDNHVTFTFITKCAYEGVDLYHPDAYTYVFSNPNLSNMAMDLSIDLIQILGRQRLDSNPWKTQATIYYQTTKEKFKISREEFDKYQEDKESFTQEYCDSFNNSRSESNRRRWIKNLDNQRSKSYFSEDYACLVTDPITGVTYATSNFLVKMAEERAYDIRNELYDNKYQVLRNLCLNIMNVNQEKVQELNTYFINNLDFPSRMCFYCSFRDSHPELTLEIIGSIVVPVRYHEYYNKYGTIKMKSVSYRESEFKKFDLIKSPGSIDCKESIQNYFKIGEKYLNRVIKSKLQEIYNSSDIKKTAKASDITQIFNTSVTDMVDSVTGKRSKGFKIISIK